MCFFLCVSLPKKDFQGWRISHSFEVTDVTDWSIGTATRRNRNDDRSFLITAGGCSCFISDGKHRSTKTTLNEFESVIQSLLKQTHCVSILVHYASGDIGKEAVIRKERKSIIFTEVSGQWNRLELDVGYTITAQQAAT